MKLISRNSGKHIRPDPPQKTTETIRKPEPLVVSPVPQEPASKENSTRKPEPQAVRVIPKPEPPQTPAAPVPSSPPKQKKPFSFRRGYLIYILLCLLIIAAGLYVLWLRMDAYERSRPYRPMEALISEKSAADWRDFLSNAGVDDGYLDTLELDKADYVKKYGVYADDRPVYSVRFGKKAMLTASLREGVPLRFGYHTWDLESLTPVDSGLTVFAPADAVVAVSGVPVGADSVTQLNAQSLTLGVFETARDDIPGLTKYTLNECYTTERISVTDASGNPLSLGYQKGNSYYYPPLTSGYVILAPSMVAVTVNGVTLTEENSAITRTPLEDFEGLGDSVPVHPEDVRYVIDGLVARPVVKAVLPDGSLLPIDDETENRFTFCLRTDDAFAEEQRQLIFEVFDAYIAFLGNRDAELTANYQRYLRYLVPGSEAADRAQKSLISLTWITGRDAALDTVSLNSVIRYSEDCFTALLDFTRKLPNGSDDNSSALFIFVRYNDQWRVLRVMNKTSFIRYG